MKDFSKVTNFVCVCDHYEIKDFNMLDRFIAFSILLLIFCFCFQDSY